MAIRGLRLCFHPTAIVLLLCLALAARFDARVLLLLLFSIVIHEVAHLVVARHYGVRVSGAGINLAGFYIRRAPKDGVEGALIAMAGPAATFAIALGTHGFPSLFNWMLLCTSLFPLAKTDLGHALHALVPSMFSVQAADRAR